MFDGRDAFILKHICPVATQTGQRHANANTHVLMDDLNGQNIRPPLTI